jgi:hypothetical protein
MNSKADQPLALFYENWRAEDRQLEVGIDGVRDWMQEVNQLGIPHFGETATRLLPLRQRLVTHFQREDQMIAQLAELYPSSSPEVQAVRRQSSRDHHQLLARLDDLIQRLGQTEPPFASWQAAMDELESFVDLLEQHEEQEADSIERLMPVEQRGDA